MVIYNRNENQHLQQKLQNGGLSFPSASPDNINKRKSFDIFLKEKYSEVAAKYTFLSSKQIKQRILDMWKKMSPGSRNPRKVEETPKHNKRQFSKKEPSLNSKHDTGEPKKSTRQPLKSKTIVPLKVDVVPAPLKGVLKRKTMETVGNKSVSFNYDPEIRYRTASEASSTSTLMQSQKEGEDDKLYFNITSAKNQYSRGTVMATNKNAKKESESEKKFDDLLNEKCSWTYKSIKTIKCQTSRQNDENGPILKIRTVNIEETAYNDDSHQKDTIGIFDEYNDDNIEVDTKEKKKNMKLTKKLSNSKIVQRYSIKGNQNFRQRKETTDKNIQRSTKSIRNRRHLKTVNYVESDTESAQSSSDDGLIFLSRRYDEGMVNGNECDNDDSINDPGINGTSQEKSPMVHAEETKYDTSDTNNFKVPQENSLKNYIEINNFEGSDKQNFEPQSCNGISETENNFDQEDNKTCFQDQNYHIDTLLNDDYQQSNASRNSKVNQISERETDLSPTETLSSLSEWESNKLEEKVKAKGNENMSRKNDLDSEILKQYLTISTEVRSVCNELETPNDDEEISSDFFGGNYVDKCKSNINTIKKDPITTKKDEISSHKSQIINKSVDLLEMNSDSAIHSNDGDDYEILSDFCSGNFNVDKCKSKINTIKNDSITTKKDENSSHKSQILDKFDDLQEMHSKRVICSNEGEDDENLSDFLSGNFTVDKCKSKINTYKNDTITSEKDENASHKSEILNKRKLDDLQKTHSDSVLSPNDGEDDEILSDFLSGNLNIEKYKSKINTDKRASVIVEKDKNGSYKSQINERLDDSSKSNSDNIISCNEKVRKHTNRKSNYAKYSTGNSHNNEYGSGDSSKSKSDKIINSNEKVRKLTNRKLDYAKYSTGKRQEPDHKMQSQIKSKVKRSLRIKEQYRLNFNSNQTSSEQSKDETGNGILEGNPYFEIYPALYSPQTYTSSSISSNEKLQNNRNSFNAKVKQQESDYKINFKYKNAIKVKSLTGEEDEHSFNMNNYQSSLEQSNEDEEGKDELYENNYSGIEDYFKEKLNVNEKNHLLSENKQKPNYFEDGITETKSGENVKNINTHQFPEAQCTNLPFPQKYNVAQQYTKAKGTENVPLGKKTNSSGVKCMKKTPKTWEDLETEILNREQQISSLDLETEMLNNEQISFFETELSPTEEFFSDEKLHHTKRNQNKLCFHKPKDTFETISMKTQNKWGSTNSKERNAAHSANIKNVDNVPFGSPNASIIERVIRRMQLCTSPVLTPNKMAPQLEHQKSPILTEYSCSVQETKSVFFKAEKKLNEKLTGQSKSTYKGLKAKNTVQNNYRFSKEQEIKTTMDSNKASITNQTSVKLKEIPKKNNTKPSKVSESDDDNIPESEEILEIESLALESDKHLTFPEDLLSPSADVIYNLRKRKIENTPTQSATKVKNMSERNSINQNKRSKTINQGTQNISSLNKNPTMGETRNVNKRKKENKSNVKNTSTDELESEDSSQNEVSGMLTTSNTQDMQLEKSDGYFKITQIRNETMYSQTNALSTSENKKSKDLSLQKLEYKEEKSMTVNRSKPKRPKRETKEEYEKYLQKLFGEDITEESYNQRELLNGTNETLEKDLMKKDSKSHCSPQLLNKHNDDELFSLSSDTDFEGDEPFPKRASGLFDDVFN